MIIVRDLNNMTKRKYDYMLDALHDIITDAMIDEFINNIWYKPIKIMSFDFTTSEVLRKCLPADKWNNLKDEIIVEEADYIEDEVDYSGEFDYWGYRIIKTSEG